MKRMIFLLCILFVTNIEAQELITGSDFMIRDRVSVVIYSKSEWDDVRELDMIFKLSVYKDTPELIVEDSEGNPVISHKYKDAYLATGDNGFLIVDDKKIRASIMYKEGKWVLSLYAVDYK